MNMRKDACGSFRLPTVAATVVLLVVGSATAATYDAVKSFSSLNNSATTPWSYRYNTTGTHDGNYALLAFHDTDGTPTTWKKGAKPVSVLYWHNNSAPLFGTTSYPLVAANKTTAPWRGLTCSSPQPITWPAKSIFLHPHTNGDVVLSFLSPKTATATVTYSVTDIDANCGNGIRWAIGVNGGADVVSGTLNSTSSANLASTGVQTFPIALHKGDRLNLIIDSNTEVLGDSTAVTESVSFP